MTEPAGPGRRAEGRGRRLADHLAEILVQGVEDYAIFTLNPEGRVVSWNPGAEAILGYAAPEIIGHSYAELLEPTAADPDALLAGVVEHGRREAEGWRVRKGGELLWARELITALHSEAGHLVAFAVLLRDETDRRLAEEARVRSEQMFTGIVNTSPDAIVSVDESQRILLFNPAAERIFGLREEEALGQPLDLLIPEPYREDHRRHVREFMESDSDARLMGERTATPLVGRRADGQIFPIEAAISRTRVDGQWMLTSVVRDITERVREASARDFLARVSLTLDSSLDYATTLREVARLAVPDWADWSLVYLVGDDGSISRIQMAHGDPAMQEVAQRLQAFSVAPGEDHPARAAIDSGEPVLIAEMTDDRLAALAHGEEHLRILQQLGLRSAVVAPLLAHGHALGAIGLFSAGPYRRFDDFDLWLAGELGRRAGLSIDNARLYDESQQAIRARDEVVSVVSHDLRNPLNSILMTAQLLDTQLGAGADPQALRKLAGIAIRSAERMNRMIQDLLDISRLESGRLQLETRPTDPGELLEEACETLRPLAAEAELRLELVCEPDLPLVEADPDRLHQVISNVAGNALKFTPAGGRITIRASATAEAVVFSVEDTGIGIPSDHLPHLFDRFWQAKRTDRRGIGLGLPIVKGIVEAHHGSVWVESEEGAGTTFSFSIPRTARDDAAQGGATG